MNAVSEAYVETHICLQSAWFRFFNEKFLREQLPWVSAALASNAQSFHYSDPLDAVLIGYSRQEFILFYALLINRQVEMQNTCLFLVGDKKRSQRSYIAILAPSGINCTTSLYYNMLLEFLPSDIAILTKHWLTFIGRNHQSS